jgi:hypothetical protein
MRKGAVFLIVVLLAGGLCYSLIRLFEIRFSQGDVYAPYSSLRADGLGTKALHDSLEDLVRVERNTRPFSRLRADDGTVLFLLGVQDGRLQEESDISDVQTLVHNGARMVMSFLPVAEKPAHNSREEEDKDKTKEGGGKNPVNKKNSDQKKDEQIDWRKLWIVKTALFETVPHHAMAAGAGMEPQISWHTLLYFDHPEAAWRTLYSCLGKPVIIERSFGKGSAVLVADSYLFSNEALSKERLPLLLSELAGEKARRVVFDETHFGIFEQPGVSTLIRQYRLHGLVVALALVAALFVWRNAVPFVPPAMAQNGGQETVQGRDAAAGFVSMLKRNIAPRDLPAICIAEWKRAVGHRIKPDIMAQVTALAESGAQQPVKTFQTITQILNEKK